MRRFVQLYKEDAEGYHNQYKRYMEDKKDKHPQFDGLRNAVAGEFVDQSAEFDKLDKAPAVIAKKSKKPKRANADLAASFDTGPDPVVVPKDVKVLEPKAAINPFAV